MSGTHDAETTPHARPPYAQLMEYRHLATEYVERTLANLETIRAAAAAGSTEAYPVTQLWNSMVGLVILPKEKHMKMMPKTRMHDLWPMGWSRVVASESVATLKDVVWLLRTAVAHFQVEFHPDMRGEIGAVTLWASQLDKDKRPIPGSKGAQMRIAASDLEALAEIIARESLAVFSSKAA